MKSFGRVSNELRESRVACFVFRFEGLPLRDTQHVIRYKVQLK